MHRMKSAAAADSGSRQRYQRHLQNELVLALEDERFRSTIFVSKYKPPWPRLLLRIVFNLAHVHKATLHATTLLGSLLRFALVKNYGEHSCMAGNSAQISSGIEISCSRRCLLLYTKAAVRAAFTRMSMAARISASVGKALACD
jgi:hypothetical protein